MKVQRSLLPAAKVKTSLLERMVAKQTELAYTLTKYLSNMIYKIFNTKLHLNFKLVYLEYIITLSKYVNTTSCYIRLKN